MAIASNAEKTNMKNIKLSLILLLSGLLVLWGLSEINVASPLVNFLSWRALLIQMSGVLAIGLMSVAMILAVRPVILENCLDGLDKMYRLHKWLGIGALVLALVHWLLAEAPKWLIDLGLLERPARPRRLMEYDNVLQGFFASLHSPAEVIGEYSFYVVVALIAISLIKRFSYRFFFKTHRILAITYLLLVVHSIVLVRFDYWTNPIGPVIALLMLAGSISAVIVLVRGIGKQRQVDAEVTAVRQYPEIGFLVVDMAMKGRWAGHRAGQFAFLTLHEDEAAHPFTIASAWEGDGRIQFVIKGLGDYTNTLAERLKVGQSARVEGPYGRFVFEGKNKRQIWIGGGIGITPFMAGMQSLARIIGGRTIDLFHTTTILDERFINGLKKSAEAANVNLHVFWDERDGFLTPGRLAEIVPDWKESDVWFCGPAGFGKALKKGLLEMGLDESQFHQELFAMR
jgi:predicted ferric reductase